MVRPRNAVKFMELNTESNGARPVAGKRPASASWTKSKDSKTVGEPHQRPLVEEDSLLSEIRIVFTQCILYTFDRM